MIIFIFLYFAKKVGSLNCAGTAADFPPAASDDRRLYLQASFSIYDALICLEDRII